MNGWIDPLLPHVPEASGSVSDSSYRSGQSLQFPEGSKGLITKSYRGKNKWFSSYKQAMGNKPEVTSFSIQVPRFTFIRGN